MLPLLFFWKLISQQKVVKGDSDLVEEWKGVIVQGSKLACARAPERTKFVLGAQTSIWMRPTGAQLLQGAVTMRDRIPHISLHRWATKILDLRKSSWFREEDNEILFNWIWIKFHSVFSVSKDIHVWIFFLFKYFC